MPTRKWRTEKRRRSTAVFWRLVAGREKRTLVSLGAVSEEQARAACERMQAMEDAGHAARWEALHAEDPQMALDMLLSDADLHAALDPLPDFANMALEDYIETEFGPWRATSTPKSWPREKRMLKQAMRDLGRYRLSEIDAHLVANHLDGLICEHGPRKGLPASGNTKRLRRAALQAVLHRAYRLKHLASEPDLSEFRIKGSTKTVREKPDPLTLDELVRLMDASAPRFRAMWAVGAGQGLRPSELVRLTWDCVDFEAGTLAIPPDEYDAGKTELSVAVVPMTPLTRKELREWWVHKGQPRSGVVFPNRYGQMYGESGYKRALDNARTKAKIARQVNPYLLRDSFATLCWSLGIDKDTCRRMMRHVDERMLDKVYQRPRPAELAKRVEAFNIGG